MSDQNNAQPRIFKIGATRIVVNTDKGCQQNAGIKCQVNAG